MLLKQEMAASGYECLVDEVRGTGGSLYFVPKVPTGEYPPPGTGRRYHVDESGVAIALE